MSKFKDRLWHELMQEYGGGLAQVTRPTGWRARRPRPTLLAGTTLGLAGLGAAAALMLSAASSSPAFAVTRNPDGTVSVTIKEIKGINGANERLAQIGVPVRVVQVASGCPAKLPPVLGARLVRPARGEPKVVRGIVTARVYPPKIPAGRTLVLPAWRTGRKIHIEYGRAVRGAAPPCLPYPPPWLGPPLHRRGMECMVKGAALPCPPYPPPPWFGPTRGRAPGCRLIRMPAVVNGVKSAPPQLPLPRLVRCSLTAPPWGHRRGTQH